MKTLVIFDIDGTLLQTADLHHRIMTKILRDDGMDPTFQPWAAYPHYTDLGVLQVLSRHYRGRDLTRAELARYEGLYAAGLRDHLVQNLVPEVAGASALLADLREMGVAMAFATGSLREMAKIKLSLLGLGDEVHLATGGEHLTREEIVRDAACRAVADAPFAAVILGDGIWDQKTAQNLGLPFVALETGTHVFDGSPAATIKDFTEITAAELAALARPVHWAEDMQ